MSNKPNINNDSGSPTPIKPATTITVTRGTNNGASGSTYGNGGSGRKNEK